MILAIYAVLGIFLLLAAKKPAEDEVMAALPRPSNSILFLALLETRR